MTYQFVPIPMGGAAPPQVWPPPQPPSPWGPPAWLGGPPSWGGGSPAPAPPSWGIPEGPGHPSQGPIYGGGYPSHGLPGEPGHPSTGPIYGGHPWFPFVPGSGYPSHGLPGAPVFPIQLPIYPIGPGGQPTPMPPIYVGAPPSVQYVVCFTVAVPPGAVFPPPAPPLDPTATPK